MIREQAFGEALNLDKLERLGRYNFVRIHKTLRVTPAMAAGVTEKLWSMEDIAELVEPSSEAGPACRLQKAPGRNFKLMHYLN